MQFHLILPQQIIFRDGIITEVPTWCKGFGRRICLVTGTSASVYRLLEDSLTASHHEVLKIVITREPTLQDLERAVEKARDFTADCIVGIGGGSVLDSAKAIGIMVANPGNLMDYIEVVGLGQTLKNPSIPVIALPTTAGTGSEVTRNAVLSVPEQKVKVSLRSPFMVPRIAAIDPQLTITMPPEVTARTGMDALTQLIEPYLSRRSNVMTDLYCREGIPLAASALLRAYQNGEDLEARRKMSYASLLGGLALANAGLGAVHGLAGPIGGMFPAPHGAICARLLPAVIRENYTVIKARMPNHPLLHRFQEIAQWVTGNGSAGVGDLVDHLLGLCALLHIPGLRDFGVNEGDLDEIVIKGIAASSMKANPVELDHESLRRILAESL
jgi:alcohol dehydrogenase class IV